MAGLVDLLDRFDAFVLDAWGVLNLGSAPIPTARAAFAAAHVTILEGLGELHACLAISGGDAIGLGVAIEYLTDLGMDRVLAHEQAIVGYACSQDKLVAQVGRAG